MFGFVLCLASFYVFVSIFSDGIGPEARWKIFGVALAAVTPMYALGAIKPPLLGLAISCLAAAAVSLVGLTFWIKVTRAQALEITGSFIGFVVAYSMGIGLLVRALGGHAA